MQDYNTVSDEMRDDCEVRADLHQRVDDVRDRLWNISDERKEQAEVERSAIMTDSWVDDHLGLVDNHLITLMQAEVDRYHDTVILVKDYYRAMEGRVPDELSTEYARLPLLEVSLPVSSHKSLDNGLQLIMHRTNGLTGYIGPLTLTVVR